MKYGFFWICDTCNEPTRTFAICSWLGYNPGVDGQFEESEEKAKMHWAAFEKAARTSGFKSDEATGMMEALGEDGKPNDTEGLLAFLNKNVKLFQITLTPIEKMNRIVIDGKTIEVPDGCSVSIGGVTVYVNGNPWDGVLGKASGIVKLVVEGTVGNINTYRAPVNVKGNVTGNINAGESITCNDVGGDASAGGSIHCDDVGGSVSAGGSVNCNRISFLPLPGMAANEQI